MRANARTNTRRQQALELRLRRKHTEAALKQALEEPAELLGIDRPYMMLALGRNAEATDRALQLMARRAGLRGLDRAVDSGQATPSAEQAALLELHARAARRRGLA